MVVLLAFAAVVAVAIPETARAQAQSSATLTINSQNASGQPLTGMWTTLAQNGQVVATGFTPAQFTLSSGQQYVATVSSYGSLVFDHWADNGSTNPARTVSITQDTTLTAVYRTASITLNPASGTPGTTVTVTGSNFPFNSAVSITYGGSAVATTPSSVATSATGTFTASFTVPASSTPGANTVQATAAGLFASATFTHTVSTTAVLTVSSQYQSGQPLTGMWTTLTQNGQTVGTGFTPVQFTVSPGAQYVATVSNYQQIVFNHWADNGSTNPARTVSITQDTTLTAVYRTASVTLTPASGPRGASVQVAGSTFTPNSAVTITYAGSPVPTTPSTITTSSTGTFTAAFTVPQSSANGANAVVATDASAVSAQATFTVSSSSAPVANNQSVNVNENSSVSITLTGSDPDGQPIRFYIASQPAHGTLGLLNESTGAVSYTPWNYYDGPDSFTFVANDGTSDSAPATVNINVANTVTKTTSKAVVITTEINGHSATGMFTTLSQNGQNIGQGYSHIDFDVNNGQQYTLTVANFENFLFDHWADNGSTNPARTVSITQDTPFYAVYKTAAITLSPSSGAVGTVVTVTGDGYDTFSNMSFTYNGRALATTPATVTSSATGAFTASFTVPSWSVQGSNVVRATDAMGITATAIFTDTATPPTSVLTVNSQNMAGNPQNGFWTTLTQNGQTVGTGFTPVQFTVTSGQQYTVTVSNFGVWRFDHWADNGSTSNSRTVSITQNTTLTAVYRNN